MKRYLLLTAAMMGVMLLLFGLVEALGVPLLTDPRPRCGGSACSRLRSGWACSSRTWCFRSRRASS